MARRRPSRASLTKKIKRTLRPAIIESLEERLQFVVLHGGDVFEFYAEASIFERVVVTGSDTTVELVGGRTTVATGAFGLTTMDGVITAGPDRGVVGAGYTDTATVVPYDTIYAIDVVQSNASTNIAVAMVPALTATTRPMEPYSGNVALEVNPTGISGGGDRYSATGAGPVATGSAILGATSQIPGAPADETNIPYLTATVNAGQFTYVPAGHLAPGLQVAGTMGNFLFGGTVTGQVQIGGSINEFYCGWLVTGNTQGEGDPGEVTYPRNFVVDGDINYLITDASIGTDTDSAYESARYVSGFDMYVGGRVGAIESYDSIVGNVDVANSSPAVGFPAGTPVEEIENRGPANYDPWDSAELGPAPGEAATFLNNDTPATAQFLGADANGDATVDGELQADDINKDDVDYYAVSLMAGETITVQVTEPTGVGTGTGAADDLDVGLFDPDGALVATDYNRVDAAQTDEEPFQFTATKPGVYHIAVGETSNSNFAAGVAAELDDFPYTLTVQGLGNLAIGGIVATNNIMDGANIGDSVVTTTTPSTPLPASDNVDGFEVQNGDFGAAVAGGNVISDNEDETPDAVYTFAVNDGNIRAVVGSQIGRLITAPTGSGATATSGVYGDMPSVYCPEGSVGLLDATGTLLAWDQFVPAETELTTAQSSAYAIGGDYEWVNGPNATVAVDLIADGSIGSIDASNMGTTEPSYLQVNATNSTSVHGVIDLIDVTNNLGLLGAGGPAISTGPGGNVRYIVVSPSTGSVYRDAFFGGGTPEETEYAPGQSVTITDDSGTLVTLTPEGGTGATVTTGTGTGTTLTYAAPATLTVTTYPIRSGGAAIVEVESTDGLSVTGSGTGSAEIGTIQLDGTGTEVTNNNASQNSTTGTSGTGTGTTTTTTTTTTGSGSTAGEPGGPPIKSTTVKGVGGTEPNLPAIPSLTTSVPLTLSYSGSIKIDTWMVTGPEATDTSLTNPTGAGGTNITTLTNTTGGEIVNMKVTSIGTLSTNGALGIPLEQNTPAAVLGFIITPLTEDSGAGAEPWSYPFLDPRSMVRIIENAVSITAAGGIGNIYAGLITSGGTNSTTTTQAVGTGAVTGGTNGNIGSVVGPVIGPIVGAGSVGSVTATSGFGSMGSGAVGGPGIYAVGVIGPVVSNGNFRGELVSIDAMSGLTVNNGSIIQASIGALEEFDYAESRANAITLAVGVTTITNPLLQIGSIAITGNGGIIGTQIIADHIGLISVATTGFGMFDDYVGTGGDGTIGGVSVGGYGIRDGTLNGGASFGSIVVHGNGSNSAVTNYSADVRQSETGAEFDPTTGYPLTFLNDIDLFLGTSKANPSILGVTDTGIIEDAEILGSRNLGSVTAYSIRGRVLPSNTVVTGYVTAITPDVSTFNVANAILDIAVTGPIDGFDLTTGRTSTYSFGGDVSDMDMTVAGPINKLVLKSSFDDGSSINAIGPSGHIGSLTIDGNLAGSVTSTTYIQSLRVLGSISGTVQATRIGTINLSGAVTTGGLTIDGPLTNLIVNGTFGPAGDPITVNGNAGVIRVKGDLAASINVTGKLNQLIVNGSILTNSDSKIGGILNLLQVAGDVQAGATLQAELIKRQRIKGQLLGTIIP